MEFSFLKFLSVRPAVGHPRNRRSPPPN